MAALARIIVGVQLLVTTRAAFHSARAITRLQGYEPATKKAAQYTSKAEDELWRTRTTQAAGVGAIAASLAGSLYLLFGHHSSSKAAVIAAGLSAASIGARAHLSGHWRDKWQVPGVRDFNQAIKDSKHLALQLAYLGAGWAASALVFVAVAFTSSE